jgi:hypothetical protein
MLERNVGKIKNIKYDSESNDMEIVIFITDNKFKKKILRDLSLSGQIKFEGDEVFFTSNISGSIDG